MQRVITYIDGFNLYFGIMDARLGKSRWLDVQALAQHLLKNNQKLVGTKYFTAEISGPPDKHIRQQTYLDALRTMEGPNFGIFYGRYQNEQVTCRNCGATYTAAREKMTDVNIAAEMLKDAFQNNFDTALLISGDADLVAPINIIKQSFHNKRIIVALPPKRHSAHLQAAAHGWFSISAANLRQSQLPVQVQRADGFILKRPTTWA